MSAPYLDTQESQEETYRKFPLYSYKTNYNKSSNSYVGIYAKCDPIYSLWV